MRSQPLKNCPVLLRLTLSKFNNNWRVKKKKQIKSANKTKKILMRIKSKISPMKKKMTRVFIDFEFCSILFKNFELTLSTISFSGGRAEFPLFGAENSQSP